MTTIDTTEIKYDRSTRDYAVLDDGRPVAFASTYSQAEAKRTAYLAERDAEQTNACGGCVNGVAKFDVDDGGYFFTVDSEIQGCGFVNEQDARAEAEAMGFVVYDNDPGFAPMPPTIDPIPTHQINACGGFGCVDGCSDCAPAPADWPQDTNGQPLDWYAAKEAVERGTARRWI